MFMSPSLVIFGIKSSSMLHNMLMSGSIRQNEVLYHMERLLSRVPSPLEFCRAWWCVSIDYSIFCYLTGVQAAYTHRWLWSLGFVLMGVIWPLLWWPSRIRSENPRLLLSWAVMCIVTAKFPLLGVHKTESLSTM